MSLRILVVSSETPAQQQERRSYSGQASHESYADALRRLRPGIILETVSCVSREERGTHALLTDYDGIIFAGSPIQMHDGSDEARSAADFMTKVFEVGTPSFGSCAGMQIAATAAGGMTGPRDPGAEVAFARNITRTSPGLGHPLLANRTPTWTAPAMHSSIITRLPTGAHALAKNPDTPVEATEIRHEQGVFWGVQYHPELSLSEIAASLRHQSDDVIEQGLAGTTGDVEDIARQLDALNSDPTRADLAWRFGLNGQITRFQQRMTEVENFLLAIAAGRLR